jgi:hypothetical protein
MSDMSTHKKHKKPDHADKLAIESLESKDVEEGLRAIYGEKGEIDFSRVEKSGRSFLEVFSKLVLVLGLISGFSWGSFLIYQQFGVEKELQRLQLSIMAENEVTSGERIDVRIKYEFPFDVALASLSIDINVPNGFVIDDFSTEPTNKDDLVWQLGSQERRARGEITLSGRWFSEVPSINSVQVFARYKPANVNAEFEEILTHSISTSSSMAKLELEGPEVATAEDIATYKFKISNTGSEMMPLARLNPTIPEGFVIIESKPGFEPGFAPSWLIPTLNPGESKEFVIRGSFASDFSGFAEFVGRLRFEQMNQITEQANQKIYTDVASSDLKVQLLLGGKNDILIVAPNSLLQTSILLENTSTTELRGLSALLDFNAEKRMPIRWSASTLGAGRLTSDGVRYDEAAIGNIASGGRKLLNAQFPIEASLNQNDSRLLTAVVRVFRGNREIKSREVQVYIATEPTFSVNLVDGEILVEVRAGNADMENMRVRLSFAKTGLFAGDQIAVEQGALGDISQSRINWNIGELKAGEQASLIIPLSENAVIDLISGDLLIENAEMLGIYKEITSEMKQTLGNIRYQR